MAKKYKIACGAVILSIIGYYSIAFLSSLLEYNLCTNTVIESVNAPDGSKKVITFATDCGATSGFGIHASILNKDQSIDNQSTGNILRLNSNQGKAWPKDSQGRPVIRVKWDSVNSVTLEYSSNSDVFYQKSELDDVQINLVSVIK